jgi:LysM repeat protein
MPVSMLSTSLLKNPQRYGRFNALNTPQPINPGMVLIKPTSIANSGGSASIETNGQVTFTTVASLSLNGVFSALYDNYIISTQESATNDNNMSLRLRSSGTDDSSANYNYQNLIANGTSVSGSRGSSGSAWILGTHGSTLRSGQSVSLYGPFLTQPTAYRGVYTHSYLSGTFDDSAGTHSLSSSYDGFTLFMATGSTTGKLTVYGVKS